MQFLSLHAIVHFNTIIHPFTLADNRHYMFYVFRYTIRRPGLTRYLLVIAYTLSRLVVWDRLAGCPPDLCSTNSPAQEQKVAQYINTPFPTALGGEAVWVWGGRRSGGLPEQCPPTLAPRRLFRPRAPGPSLPTGANPSRTVHTCIHACMHACMARQY